MRRQSSAIFCDVRICRVVRISPPCEPCDELTTDAARYYPAILRKRTWPGWAGRARPQPAPCGARSRRLPCRL